MLNHKHPCILLQWPICPSDYNMFVFLHFAKLQLYTVSIIYINATLVRGVVFTSTLKNTFQLKAETDTKRS